MYTIVSGRTFEEENRTFLVSLSLKKRCLLTPTVQVDVQLVQDGFFDNLTNQEVKKITFSGQEMKFLVETTSGDLNLYSLVCSGKTVKSVCERKIETLDDSVSEYAV
jgi:hypothetical protein